MSPRPFRFAVGLADGVDLARLIDTARRAESLGYAALLLPDHLLDPLTPLPALAAVAEATSRLRIGTFVLNNDLRHPALLAKELATLDQLSGGRLEIGLGAGWNAEEYQQAGLPFEGHRVRVERLAEAIQVLKGLFDGGPFTFHGRHYQVTGLEGRTRPIQRPYPPFLIGGGGRSVLELAAREAQIVGLAPRIPAPYQHDPLSCLDQATHEKLGWVRGAAGSRFGDLELNTYPALAAVRVTSEARAAARDLADRLRARDGVELSPEELLRSPHVFFGTVEQLVEKCLGLRERFAISYIMVGGAMEAFAPVVERLAGR